jgi:hypothetical protein
VWRPTTAAKRDWRSRHTATDPNGVKSRDVTAASDRHNFKNILVRAVDLNGPADYLLLNSEKSITCTTQCSSIILFRQVNVKNSKEKRQTSGCRNLTPAKTTKNKRTKKWTLPNSAAPRKRDLKAKMNKSKLRKSEPTPRMPTRDNILLVCMSSYLHQERVVALNQSSHLSF